MSKNYNHLEVEKKWSERWLKDNIYKAEDFSTREKRYILVEFPYPSGTGLHCGHVYRFTMPDVYVRKLRMEGYNVLFPMGWDAFGLPAENYAVKTGVHPAITTEQAINTFRSQLQTMGYSFDWSREISSTDPSYYKWTQWIFTRLWERGLAELTEQPVWWCDALRTVLANEEVLDDGKGGKISERGEHPVEKRMLKQWVLKMPRYADKLLDGLDTVDFPESVRSAQRNWIGKSLGAKLSFPLSHGETDLEVFTTRPDTILGATFMVLAPEHPLIDQLKSQIDNWEEVTEYRAATKNRSELERKASKEKTGVVLQGVSALNPLDESLPPLPLYIADYVLMEYGTGSIMAVPAHDDRDFEFAKKFNLPIVPTIASSVGANDSLPFVGDQGIVILNDTNRKIFGEVFLKSKNGQVSSEDMKEFVVQFLERQGRAEKKITYKIRDWLFSRQRYWGEPIPLLHREDGEIEALVDTTDTKEVQEKLPLLLPSVPDYLPSADGYSPLAKNSDWVQTTDRAGKPATRETNTMPNWAGSCWYYLRFIDPKNDQAFADQEKLKYWLPVDKYFGGSEHTTLHLLYSRFWHKFLYDEKLVPTPEPYAWRLNGGILLGTDSQKMSKSAGNVVNPDEKVARYGADALRLYINFMGPYDGTLPWSENGLRACRKLVERIFALRDKLSDKPSDEPLLRSYHKLVKRVGAMIDNLRTNTVVSEFMIFVRDAEAATHIDKEIWKGFLKVLAPMAVYSAEELWQDLHGYKDWNPENSVHLQQWPKYDEAFARDEIITVGVQVNGKVRDQVEISLEEEEESVREKVMQLPGVQRWTDGKSVKKFVYVKGRIVNLVVG